MTGPIQDRTLDTFTAVAEATFDGKVYVAEGIPFDQSGVALVAQSSKTADGEYVFQILRVNSSRKPGFARFEKTCFQPVHFNVYRNGEPLQQVVVKSTFDVMTLDLNH